MNAFRASCMLIVVLLQLCPSRALGLAGDLDRPSLSFPTGFENAQAMLGVISDKQFEFKGGRFINAGSTLDYAGKADSLNGFLARLAACKGAKVSVSFSANDADWSWRLHHHAWVDPSAFHIVVNTRHIVEANVNVPNAETRGKACAFKFRSWLRVDAELRWQAQAGRDCDAVCAYRLRQSHGHRA